MRWTGAPRARAICQCSRDHSSVVCARAHSSERWLSPWLGSTSWVCERLEAIHTIVVAQALDDAVRQASPPGSVSECGRNDRRVRGLETARLLAEAYAVGRAGAEAPRAVRASAIAGRSGACRRAIRGQHALNRIEAKLR